MLSPLNLERIAKNKADILAARQDIVSLVNLNREKFLSEKKNIHSLKYLLIQAVEAIADTCQHILSKLKGLPCEGYVDCIVKAGENQIISKALAEKLRSLADLRNILVHRYRVINDEELYKQAKKNISDFEDFVCQIDELIIKVAKP